MFWSRTVRLGCVRGTFAVSSEARRDILHRALLPVLTAIMVLPGSLTPPMELWDESRNANNAMEIAKHGGWTVPTFGHAPDHWNTRPPLLIWIVAALLRSGMEPMLAVRLAFDATTGFSVMPPRLASLTGAAIGGVGLLLLGYTLFGWLTGRTVEGWTSLMLILGGTQLLLLGVFGEYLGRLYIEAKRRPLFVVDRVLTHKPAAAERRDRIALDMAAILSRSHGQANEQETRHEIRNLL
jgi:hypothetical protein